MSDASHRMDDDEVLFTSMILMFGEPPRLPRKHSFEDKLRMAHDLKEYALRVKDMMAELGHDPHIGLYTSYVYWCDHEWKSAAEKRLERDRSQAEFNMSKRPCRRLA